MLAVGELVPLDPEYVHGVDARLPPAPDLRGRADPPHQVVALLEMPPLPRARSRLLGCVTILDRCSRIERLHIQTSLLSENNFFLKCDGSSITT